MALHDAAVGCWDAKFAYFNPRPSQLDPEMLPAEERARLVSVGRFALRGVGHAKELFTLDPQLM